MSSSPSRMSDDSSSNASSHASPSSAPTRNSRILSIKCEACGDLSSGKHYGIYACDGCAGFFKRSVRKLLNEPEFKYTCTMRNGPKKKCYYTKEKRNDCKYCRFQRCLEAGMNRDAVQQERGARKPRMQAHPYLGGMASNTVVVQGPSPPLALTVHPNMPWEALRGMYPPIYQHTSMFSPNMITLAASLQSLNIEWCLKQTPFSMLSPTDKTTLLCQSWSEHFLVAFAIYCQTYHPGFDLKTFIQSALHMVYDSTRFFHYVKQIDILCEDFNHILSLNLNVAEMEYLRCIALYNPLRRHLRPDFPYGLENVALIDATHKQWCDDLIRWPKITADRASKLMILAEKLYTVNACFVELVFFKSILGDITMLDVCRDLVYKYSTLFHA